MTLQRTAKSCGSGAPTLALRSRERFRERRWQKSPVTGKSTKETVKTIAQGMPVDAVYLWLLTRVLFLLHTRPRVQRASGIPCALFVLRDTRSRITRTRCAARMRAHVSTRAVIARTNGPQANTLSMSSRASEHRECDPG